MLGVTEKSGKTYQNPSDSAMSGNKHVSDPAMVVVHSCFAGSLERHLLGRTRVGKDDLVVVNRNRRGHYISKSERLKGIKSTSTSINIIDA